VSRRSDSHESRGQMIYRGPIPEDNYTVISNAIIDDQSLSFKARGILLYLLAKPANWRCLVSDLAKGLDRECAIRSGLKELRQVGYVTFATERDPDRGHITQRYYRVYSSPQTNPGREHPNGERKSLKDKRSSLERGFLNQANDNQANHNQANLDQANLDQGNRAQQSIKSTNDGKETTTTGADVVSDVVVSSLRDRGVTERTARRLGRTYGPDRVQEAIRSLDEVQRRRTIASPAGWLVKFLDDHWESKPTNSGGPGLLAPKQQDVSPEVRGAWDRLSYEKKVEGLKWKVDNPLTEGDGMQAQRVLDGVAPPSERMIMDLCEIANRLAGGRDGAR
jgi:hypothetical protein